MTVKEFVDGYIQLGSEQLKEKYVKDNLNIEPYVPFQYKKELCESIVAKSFFEHDNEIDALTGTYNNVKIQVDSNVNYFLFNMMIINTHTDLEIDEYSYELFDLLASSGVLEVILKTIPESELVMWKFVNQNVINDFMANHCSTKAYMEQLGLKVVTGLEGFLSVLLESVDKKIQNGDIDIEGLMNYINTNKKD